MTTFRCRGRTRSLSSWVAGAALAATGCGEEAAVGVARWPCPVGWVAFERGGCGPAVLLCVPDGGAASGACGRADAPGPQADGGADGGAASAFRRLPDGAIGGAWREPGEPGGPPREDWAPDAGIQNCPTDWARKANGTCDPNLREDCPEGSGPLPGGACTPTALPDCPATEYAAPDPEAMAARRVYVRAGAEPAGADGTMGRPYPTLGAGVEAAGPDGWVFLAQGTYGEGLLVRTRALHVVGRCAARVTIAGDPMSGTPAAVVVSGRAARLTLRGVTVRGAPGAVSVGAGGALTASRAAFVSAAGYAVSATDRGTQVTIEESVVRDTRAGGAPAASVAVGLGRAARIDLRAVLISRGEQVGILVDGADTRATLRDVVVREIGLARRDNFSRALIVQPGATVEATRVVLTDNVGEGITVGGADEPATALTLEDSVVRRTRPHDSGKRGGAGGRGVSVGPGGTLVATGLLVEDSTTAGVMAIEPSARVDLRGSVVRGTQALPDNWGRGLWVRQGSHLTATGLVVEDNQDFGVLAFDPETEVTLRESVVRRTRARPEGCVTDNTSGGLVALGSPHVEMERVLLDDNEQAGVVAGIEGTDVAMTDCVVRGTHTRDGMTCSLGLAVEAGAALRATRALVADNESVGVKVSGAGTRVTLDACVVRGTHQGEGDLRVRGLNVQRGASFQASRLLVDDNEAVGFWAADEGTEVTLESSAVRRTRLTASGTLGRGVEVYPGATLRAAGLLVTESGEQGLMAFGPGVTITLSDALVVGTTPRLRGFGIGLHFTAGVTVSGDRVAVQRTHGAAIAAAPYGDVRGTTVTLRDVFVRGVGSSSVEFSGTGQTTGQLGPPVAYGLHVGPQCTLRATRAVLDDGGYGFYNAAGALSIDRAVITRQRDAVGALGLSTREDQTTLREVRSALNGSPEVRRGSALPWASAIPSPSAPPAMGP